MRVIRLESQLTFANIAFWQLGETPAVNSAEGPKVLFGKKKLSARVESTK